MSASRRAAAIGLLLVAACASGPEPDERVQLGRPMTAAELAFWDSSISPDGANLPAGSGGSVEGAATFAQKCAVCHGATGAETNTRLTPLVGGIGTLGSSQPVTTVGSYWPYATTVFDYIRRAMPYDAPKSLGDDEVYALTAYLLSANGIIDKGAVLDRETLPGVKMPNRDGFVNAWTKF
jgi:S-disulfanyl-L-cysteine oxidoreductase SoxD